MWTCVPNKKGWGEGGEAVLGIMAQLPSKNAQNVLINHKFDVQAPYGVPPIALVSTKHKFLHKN